MWYINEGLKPAGPFEVTEIQDRIKKGQLGPKDLVYREDVQEWKQAQEWDELRRIGFPAMEAINTDEPENRVWVLLMLDKESKNYKQAGPFNVSQIKAALTQGQIRPEDLIWKSGLSGWSRVQDREEFILPAP